MKSKNQLKVIPLNRSYRPKYPSYFDKNPIEYPDSRPYPYSKKFINSISMTGLIGAILFSTGCKSQDNPKSLHFDKLLYNTFPVSKMNLPFSPAIFGTGLPKRLSREDVLDLFDKVFEAEGLEITKDTVISYENINITANTYNKKYNIGYILVDYSNYGDGMINENRLLGRREFYDFDSYVDYFRKAIENNYEKYQKDPNQFFSHYEDESLKLLKQDLNSNISLENSKQYFIKRFADYKLKKITRISEYDNEYFEEQKWVDNILQRIEDKIKAYAMIYLYKDIMGIFNYSDAVSKDIFYKEIHEINNMQNTEKWERRVILFINSIKRFPRYFVFNNTKKFFQKYTEIVKNHQWENRADYFNILDKYIDKKYISLDEVNILEKDVNDKKYFIAPISHEDHRFIVPSANFHYSFKKLDVDIRNLRLAQSQFEKDSIKNVIEGKEDERRQLFLQKQEEIKLEKLKRLEEDVRTYIKWAKFQQGY